MRILVTGASGMLGRAVAETLLENSYQVVTFQRRPAAIPGAEDALGSLTNLADLERAVLGCDAVIHLAAKVSFAGDYREFEAVNIIGTQNLITAMKKHGVKKLVNISSPSVAHLGESIVGLPTTPPDPKRARGNYARTKAQAEIIAMENDDEDFQVVSIRPHVVWGPGDQQLVGRIVDRGRKGTLPLLDAGQALIDSTFVSNAADAIAAALERIEEVHGESFVVTNGEPRTVADVLNGFCSAAGVPGPKLRIPSGIAKAAGRLVEKIWAIRPGQDEPPMTEFLAEQLSTAHWFDQRRTQERLQWKPRVSFDQGIEELRAYFKEHPVR